MSSTSLPLLELPDLSKREAAARWRATLERRMREAGHASAADVECAGDFDLGGFDDAFSRLRRADADELRRWFVDQRGERATALAHALEIPSGALVDDLRDAARPPPAPWHPAFPGVAPDTVQIAPPIPEIFREPSTATTSRSLSEAIAAWWAKRAEGSSKDTPVITWVVGPPGSGRHTLARHLAESGLGPVVDAPPDGDWHRWLRAAEPPQIAVVDATQQATAVGRSSAAESAPETVSCVVEQWSAQHLERLIERLAEQPGGLRGRALNEARRLVQRWAAEPGLLGATRTPADLIEMLGVIRDEPDRASAPRDAALRGRWRAIRRRGDNALAPWDHRLPAAFWRACWLDDEITTWRRPTRAQAERAMGHALAEQAQHQTVEAQLDALASTGRGRTERVARLRRTLAARGPSATLAGLIEAGTLRAADGPGDHLEATDPDGAAQWVAVGLAARGTSSFEGCWTRLTDVDWPTLAAELVRVGWSINDVLAATRDAPDFVRADVARGVLHAFDASPSETPSRRQLTTLRRAWLDGLWVVLTGLTQLKGGAGDAAHGLFRESARVVSRLSRRFAAHLPRFEGPDFARALREQISPAIARMTDGWHYAIDVFSTSSPFRRTLDLPAAAEAAFDLDLGVARLAPTQCATARVEALPGASLEGTTRQPAFMGTPEGIERNSFVARRDFVRRLPDGWWDAIARQAEQGDADAMKLLSGVRAPLWDYLPASDDPTALFVPTDITDEALAAQIEGAEHPIRSVVRGGDSPAPWGALDRSGVVLDPGGPSRPRVMRLPTDKDRIEIAWQRVVPERLRHRWLAHAPGDPRFPGLWEKSFDRRAGRFAEMTERAPRELVRLLINRALDLPTDGLELPVDPRVRVYRPPLTPPALLTVLRWAVDHRDRATLRALVELPRRWCETARLGGRLDAFAVTFAGQDRHRSDDDLGWARCARWPVSAAQLFEPWRALDDLAHAAAVALYDLGQREPLEVRWSATVFGFSLDWGPRAALLVEFQHLADVPWAAIEAALGGLPPDAEAWTRAQLVALDEGQMRGEPFSAKCGWDIARYVLEPLSPHRPPIGFGAWLRGGHRREGCRALRELAEQLTAGWIGPHPAATSSRPATVAALLVGSLAERGLAPEVELPPSAVVNWLRGLPPETRYPRDPLGQALSAAAARRRRMAARSLVEAGDPRPIAAWFDEPRTSGATREMVHAAVLTSRATLDRWLSRLTLDHPTMDDALLAAALEWRLPRLHAVWRRSTPDRRRRVALAHADHPMAADWLRTLYDEAWCAGAWREAALWAWMVFEHHRPDDPCVAQIVERWALEDPDPFDHQVFLVRHSALVGGGGALVVMMDARVRDIGWARCEEATRRLYGYPHAEWPRVSEDVMRLTDEQHAARSLPWLTWGHHEGIGGWELRRHMWGWLRAIDAVDLRDAALDLHDPEWRGLASEPFEWWLTSPDPVLWAALDRLLAALHTEGCSLLDARLGRAGSIVRALIERDPEPVLEWAVDRCPLVFEQAEIDEQGEGDWSLDNHEVGAEALVEIIAAHRPTAVEPIWRGWWSAVSTTPQRRWVLRHLALRAMWHGPDAARAAVLLRTWSMEGSG